MNIADIDEKLAIERNNLNALLAEANRQIGVIQGRISLYEEMKNALTPSKNGKKPADKVAA